MWISKDVYISCFFTGPISARSVLKNLIPNRDQLENPGRVAATTQKLSIQNRKIFRKLNHPKTFHPKQKDFSKIEPTKNFPSKTERFFENWTNQKLSMQNRKIFWKLNQPKTFHPKQKDFSKIEQHDVGRTAIKVNDPLIASWITGLLFAIAVGLLQS